MLIAMVEREDGRRRKLVAEEVGGGKSQWERKWCRRER